MKTTKPWFVYVVQCKDGTLYTGMSTDPHRRLRQHNGEISGGAGYTRRRRRRPCKLLCYTMIGTATNAAKIEREIKKLTRKDKVAFIKACQDNQRALGLDKGINELDDLAPKR